MPKLADCLKVQVDRKTQAKRLEPSPEAVKRWVEKMERKRNERIAYSPSIWAQLSNRDPDAQG